MWIVTRLILGVIPRHTLDLLKVISEPLADSGFYLAGGTALALRLGHRVSVDLDFFTSLEFDPEAELSKLEEIVGEGALILQRTKGSACLTLQKTKVELPGYRYSLLSPVELHEGVALASLPDNVAMKLSALVGRGSKKDFVDIAALLKRHSLEEMLGWFSRKFPNAETFMVLKSLAWFDDAEEEPDPVFFERADLGRGEKSGAGGYARIPLITLAGSTPVRRMSRPWNFLEKRWWSMPRRWRRVAWKSRTWTMSLTAL